MIKTISADELKTKLQSQPEILVVDVREQHERDAESIDGTCPIPLKEVCVAKLPKKDGPIVIHCAAGRRSLTACEMLLNESPNLEVYSLSGGIKAWKQAGGKVNTLGGHGISIFRQVQIIAGSLCLLGVLGGWLISPWFYALAGFIGAGLAFAGVSGWCGMGLLLQKMPWNK